MEDVMTMWKPLSLAFLLMLLTPLGFAQGVTTGDLHVTVKDPKGALVTNATVTARDQAKAFERSTAENANGEYQQATKPSPSAPSLSWSRPRVPPRPTPSISAASIIFLSTVVTTSTSLLPIPRFCVTLLPVSARRPLPAST
jgi:hypothetical protein